MVTVAAAFVQFRCPLELVLTPNILICVCKETWIDAIISELEALKVGKNREFSRFLQFSWFSTNFDLLDYGQNFWYFISNLAYYTIYTFINNYWGLQVLQWPISVRRWSPNFVFFNFENSKNAYLCHVISRWRKEIIDFSGRFSESSDNFLLNKYCIFLAKMLPSGWKIDLKISIFCKNSDFFTQKGRGKGVVKIADRKIFTWPITLSNQLSFRCGV